MTMYLVLKSCARIMLAGALGVVMFAHAAAVERPDGPLVPARRSSTPGYREPPAHASSHALNWAGYIATGQSYTSVSGSWIVPRVADSSENVADATWVGIGGAISTDLIQAGTEAIPGDNGSLVYQAWYELLPDNSIPVPLRIAPGDVVSVSITRQSAGQWLVSFTNASTGQRYEKTVQYDSSLSSADWIEEMPVEVGGVMGLDNFGAVHFSAGYAIVDGVAVSIAQAKAKAVVMDNTDGAAIAVPSQLDIASGFTVSRTEAEASPLVLSQGQYAAPVTDTDTVVSMQF